MVVLSNQVSEAHASEAHASEAHADRPSIPRCIHCNGRPQEVRGLCNSCYGTYRYMVLKGRTTWHQLEKEGICHPPVRRY